MKMYITEKQARELLANRVNSTFDNQGKRVYSRTGKATKKRIYAEVRRAHGIPHSRKIKFFIEDPSREHYRVISDKLTGEALDDGMAAPVAVSVVAPAVAPVAPVAPKAKAPAKTAAPKAKAPTKTAAKTAKPAAKVVKAPVKAVATAKTVAKAPAKSVTKVKPTVKVVKPAAKAVKPVAKPVAKKTVAKKSK